MNRLTILRTSTALALLALAVACSDDDEKLPSAESTGGATGAGGSTPSSGGTTASSGGATAAGGTATSGGTTSVADGGTTATQGGTTSTSGGTTAAGGVTSTAGTTSTAGKTSSGGTTTGGGATSTAGKTSTGGVTPVAGTAGAVTTGGAPANGGTSSTAGETSLGGVAGDTSAAGASTGGVDNTAGDTGAGGTNGAAGSEGTGGTAGASATAAYCLGSTAAFCDDFEDGDATGWNAYEQYGSSQGVWAIASQAGYNGATSYVYQQTAIDQRGYHYRIPPTAAGGPWTDQTVTAWVRPDAALGDDNTKIGICARASGADYASLSAYCFFLRLDAANTGYVQLSRKTSAGISTALPANTTRPAIPPIFEAGTWHKVTLSVSGSANPITVNGYVDDVLYLTFSDTDATILSGYPAIVTRQGSAGSSPNITLYNPGLGTFDNVTLTSP